MFTLWHSSHRLRAEQLEKRAKERHQALQTAYGQYAGACFRFFHNIRTLDKISTETAGLFNYQQALSAPDLARFKEGLIRSGDSAETLLWASFADIHSGYANLLVLDDNQSRLDQLAALHFPIVTLRGGDGVAKIDDLGATLQAFARAVGLTLWAEYQQDADRAGKGRHRAIGATSPTATS